MRQQQVRPEHAEMVGRNAAFYGELFDVCTEMMLRLHDLRQPVIQRFELRGQQPVIAVGVPIGSVGASYFELTPLDEQLRRAVEKT